MTSPLTGVRVLDLTRVVAGPSCGRSLVELGAEVIKLEPPEGDLTRKARPRVGGIPVYYSQLNAGKFCISLDLGSAEGRLLAARIAATCDVVVENFRPGVASRLGLGFEELSASNPGLVYCSITGYGQSGPNREARAYAPVVHAEIGHLEFAARQLSRETSHEAVSHADHAAGQQATIGILAALVARGVSGVGTHVDVSMAEAMWAINEWTSIEAAGGTDEVSVMGSHRAPIFRVGDGTQVVATGDPAGTFVIWARLMGRPELMDDERFATGAARNEHRDEMSRLIGDWTATIASYEAFEDVLEGSGIVAGRVRTIAEAVKEPWVEHREAFVDVDSNGEAVRIPRSPIRMSGHTVGDRRPTKWQGQDNGEVLGSILGLDDDQIAALTADGVLIERPA